MAKDYNFPSIPTFDWNNHSWDQIQNNKNIMNFLNFDMVWNDAQVKG
jgi:hypothetical protein